MPVSSIYQRELTARGFVSDPAQLQAIAALQRCASEWTAYKEKRSSALKKLINRPPIPRGVYMYGGVGRGKSFLMDCFYEAVPIRRKTRLHFHEFMREKCTVRCSSCRVRPIRCRRWGSRWPSASS